MSSTYTIVLSEKGFNFDGEPLTEDNLEAGQRAYFDKKLYKTGNRRNDAVELFQEGELQTITSIKNICLVK